ncbi:hypothetical protein SAMN02745225_02385 [Ferrithrix thermotolerans DSM 19514]|uniref:Uncharacterized protein n=1 Tax=Ferrithrix thermotolerans DSM 19514 TaxID=1121881 RepID=A0A1M4YPY0_9ACTN|nr:hypothetical protein [Ferrithrix thermotolerans]SHF07687.1 hypothetical protein SAMN02745225_02385 [Ferrithrix thermotolerans DSM 19514]
MTKIPPISSKTVKLPNGNRVTVTVGSNRYGFYKKVTVRRPNGNSETRIYQRGLVASFFLSGYDTSIPKWAQE